MTFVNEAGYEVELDAFDLQADAEAKAIGRHRKMRRETMEDLGMIRKVTKGDCKRKGLVRGCRAAKQRMGSIEVPIGQMVSGGPLTRTMRLSEMRREV